MLISPSVLRTSNLVISNQRPTLAITVDAMLVGFAWVSQDISAAQKKNLAPLSTCGVEFKN
jgi:hypothetical protein